MRYSILVCLFFYSVLSQASTIKNQIFNTPPIIVASGVLSPKPIISDSTFARIAKKNNLSSKKFDDEDLQKLDKKFTEVIKKLKKEQVFDRIAKIAPRYGVSPEVVAACIIGEHVFNVTLIDNFQSYFINIYSSWVDKHSATQHLYLALLKEPDIEKILNSNTLTDYDKWDTIFDVYNQKYRGKDDYPDSGFIFSFFNPYGAGLTYGLGQLSPVRVLLTNDIAVKLGGLKRIKPTDTEAMYFATLDVDSNINYVAASAVVSILNYNKYANFDISNNIGIIATLYNLGAEKRRAIQLAKINESRVKENKEIELPVENFYGWYMNKKEKDIKELFKK